jgi:NADH-quinone oxidoreductase subunit H
MISGGHPNETLGTLDPRAIVERQIKYGWNLFGGGNLALAFSGVLGFILFFVAALAENNRLPFDLPECEAELVGGYHTEYSSMKFALFMMGEYVGMTVMAALMTTFFLGGWSLPFGSTSSSTARSGGRACSRWASSSGRWSRSCSST